ncbi:MAG: lipocalin/fatty acid-binding family protein [Candidatus Acidiferrales bacterium]
MSKKIAVNILRVFFLTILLTASAIGQVKPNFSGTWKQNNAKSKLAPDAPVWVHKIEQKGAELKVETTITGSRGVSSHENTYTTDGKKQMTKDRDGDALTRSVKWEGNTLVFLTVEKERGNTLTTREIWRLSNDGKTLVKTRHLTGPRGVTDQKYVYDKQ